MSPRLVIFLIVCLGISASVEGPGFTMVPADTPKASCTLLHKYCPDR